MNTINPIEQLKEIVKEYEKLPPRMIGLAVSSRMKSMLDQSSKLKDSLNSPILGVQLPFEIIVLKNAIQILGDINNVLPFYSFAERYAITRLDENIHPQIDTPDKVQLMLRCYAEEFKFEQSNPVVVK